jgi:hypothetical protein
MTWRAISSRHWQQDMQPPTPPVQLQRQVSPPPNFMDAWQGEYSGGVGGVGGGYGGGGGYGFERAAESRQTAMARLDLRRLAGPGR